MDEDNRQAAEVLARFGRSGCALVPLGNAGGFSGARLWRVDDGALNLLLRRWPDEYEEGRLRWIQATVELAGSQLNIVPRLQRTPSGETLVEHAGHFWELTTWLPGVADYRESPLPERLAAALNSLARLHLVWEYFPTRLTGPMPSPGIKDRIVRLEALSALLPELRNKLRGNNQGEIAKQLRLRGEILLEHFDEQRNKLRDELVAARNILVPLQPCLRDIWHDHVLFIGNNVTGIIDYGATKIDSVATDLARLIGSLVGDDVALNKAALTAYEAIRPLAADERRLIGVFDRSSLLMSGLNWLDWILIEGREFGEMGKVYTRLDELIARLTTRTEGIVEP